MTHLYSRGCEYALRALRAMVEEPRGVSTVSRLCQRAEIPEHFTRKMLQPLVRAGILRSARGPGGGFAFGRSPAEISLMDVIGAIESSPRQDVCILGLSSCDLDNPCPLHHQWEPIRNAVQQMLEGRTIADLASLRPQNGTTPPAAPRNGTPLGGHHGQPADGPEATTPEEVLPELG